MLTPIDKLSYAARQASRVAWFMGHGLATGQFRQTQAGGSDVARDGRARRAPGLNG
jgi:hypothetical protein